MPFFGRRKNRENVIQASGTEKTSTADLGPNSLALQQLFALTGEQLKEKFVPPIEDVDFWNFVQKEASISGMDEEIKLFQNLIKNPSRFPSNPETKEAIQKLVEAIKKSLDDAHQTIANYADIGERKDFSADQIRQMQYLVQKVAEKNYPAYLPLLQDLYNYVLRFVNVSLENEDPFWNQLAPSHIGAERYAQIMYGALVTEYNQKIEKEKQEKALEQESKLLKFMELYGLSIAPPRTYSKRFQATVGEHYSYYQLMAAVPHLRNAISAPNEAIHDNAMREAKRLFTIQLFDQQIYERNVQSILAKIYNHIIMDEEQQALIKIELLSAWYREYLRAYNEGINTRYTS